MPLDQFYTNPDIALKCVEMLTDRFAFDYFDKILEPSAGTGSFYRYLPEDKRIGIDLEPKYDGVQRGDFFAYEADDVSNYLVIGNPPFGRVSSMAIRFFNQAAKFADVIAFIIPRTFKRVSVQNQLDPHFHLTSSWDLPLKCFTPVMDAKCCFQIWDWRPDARAKVELAKTHPDFSFIKYESVKRGRPPVPQGADFALHAYGSNCGQITRDTAELAPKSWHWIQSNIDIDTLIDRFGQLDFSISRDTVRQDSIGQQDLIELYTKKYGK